MVVTKRLGSMRKIKQNRNTFRGISKAELERKTDAILRAMTVSLYNCRFLKMN